MNEKFFALPQERQEQIINAAYEVFSRNSYKNASMSRLADAGGVSKSLLFHYFLNKKELYLYLWEHAGRLYREKVRKGDTQLLLEEINGYLLSCYWKMFSTGELDPDFLEKDFLKRVGQWKRVYLKERNH